MAVVVAMISYRPIGRILRWLALVVAGGTSVASAQTSSAITSVARTSAATVAQDTSISYTVGYTAGTSRVQSVQVILIGPSGTQRELESRFAPSADGTAVLSATVTTAAWPVGDWVVANVLITDETNRNIQYRGDGSIARSPEIAGAASTHTLNYYTTQGFQLTVSPASFLPKITVQPQSQSVNLRGTVSFFVAATSTGTGTLTYQWAKNGVPIPGAIGEALVLGNLQISDAGNYTVVVTNNQGSTTSNVATLTVNPLSQPPSFVQQPANATATDGEAFAADVRVQLPDGTSEVTWKANVGGRSLTGVVTSSSRNSSDVLTASLSFGPVTVSDAGLFQIAATNPYGSTLSQARILTVNAAAPSITAQPRDRSVEADESVTLSVTASGTGPLSYRWRKNSSDIAGATSATYTIARAQASDSGSYTVVVANRIGSVESAAARVTVAAVIPPSITTEPVSQTALVSATVTFTVVAASTRPVTYQWQKDGVAIPGATAAALVLTSVIPIALSYYTLR